MMYPKEVEKLLLKVQKPGRYVGGEAQSVIKEKKMWKCVLLSVFRICMYRKFESYHFVLFSVCCAMKTQYIVFD